MTPPDVLPFGATRTADTLYWDTTASDDPDQWPVVMHCQDDENAGRDPWRRFATPLVPTPACLVADGMRPVAARSGMQTDLEHTPWTPPPRRPEPTAQQRATLTTGSGLETLIALVPPPETPALGKHNWDWLYERLGTRLPGEYIQLMERYGAGSWCGWLRFNTPFGEDQYALAPWAEWYAETYQGQRAEFPEHHPLAVYPEPGGFLPFADSSDGDQLCWLTEGATPDDWPLIVVPRHADQGPPLNPDLTKTLLAWLRGIAALKSKGPVSRERLSGREWDRLEGELKRGPLAHGFADDQRWTLRRIKTLIGRLFHRGYTVQGVARLLKRHGWSCQVPVCHAVERDEAAIEMWKDEVWPRLKGQRLTWAPASVSRTRRARG